nr:immunoglobulin heavy chain junction region [Mus musculus]MBK4196630.1 immunoglobulin heavy chain junction region [Mus musculus]MBK4196631.1 immunoglobulin heavy chain junction region [Mus musculus]
CARRVAYDYDKGGDYW